MAKILVVGCGPLPFEAARIHSGPGIRTWQLTAPLLAAEHTVCVAALCEEEALAARDTSRGFLHVRLPLAQAADGHLPALAELLTDFAPDLIVGATAFPSFLAARLPTPCPLWADLFGDPMAEAQARAAAAHDDWAVANNRFMVLPVLDRADVFSTVSDRQKDSLIGQLGLRGRLNQHTAGHDLVRVIPCACDEPASPAAVVGRHEAVSATDRCVVLSSGGFNTWVDTEILLAGLEYAMARHEGLQFTATGGPIPGFDETTYQRFAAAVVASPYRDRFELRGWLPREEADAVEAAAHVGLVAELPRYERRLGSANRCLQWMARGLPVVCARLSELAETIHREELGLTYPVGDAAALGEALLVLARDPARRLELASRARDYVEDHFTFAATAAPLVSWASAAALAPDRMAVPPPAASLVLAADQAGSTAAPREGQAKVTVAEVRPGREEEVAALRQELATIHGSRVWRLWMASIRMRSRLAADWQWLRGLPRVCLDAVGAALGFLRDRIVAMAAWLYLFLATARRLIPAAWRRPRRRELQETPPSLERRPRVLIVCPYPLIPAYQGGSSRIVNLIRALSVHCDLYLLTFSSTSDDPAQRQALSPYCRRIYVHRRQDAPPPRPGDLEPRSVQLFTSQAVRERLRDIVWQERIDIVQLEFTELGQYADAFGTAKVVLTELDLGFVTSFRRRAAGFHKRFETDQLLWSSLSGWMRLFRFELDVCSRVDQVHVMSETDGALLARFLGDGWARIRVVPNGVVVREEEGEVPPDAVGEVLFVGYFGHTPNLDALHYLHEEIWPRVRQQLPGAALTVVGANPPSSVTALDGCDGIRVVGTVPDPGPYYRGHRLLLAPLRAGSGTRLKILEAFVNGLPVVSTPLGAEGIGGRDGEHFMLGRTAADLAAAVCRLLEDDALRQKLAAAGRTLAQEKYGWESIARQALAGYQALLPSSAEPDRALPAGDEASADEVAEGEIDISVIIPTFHGGARLLECLDAIMAQRTDRSFEVVCVDSGSAPAECAAMQARGARVTAIPNHDFNHGLTRDLGARLARGRVLVFLNQDAVPCNGDWLQSLTDPLLRPGPYAAIQGGIREVPEESQRFFWHSCGGRFYFTRESDRWIENFDGIGFSTVNAALRREAWAEIPFGWAPIMEDKKWQRQARDGGLRIAQLPSAAVFHTHDYDLRALIKRCAAEGYGWQALGLRYGLGDLLGDLFVWDVYREQLRGVVRRRIRSAAELFFPWLRPLALYWGNRHLRALP